MSNEENKNFTQEKLMEMLLNVAQHSATREELQGVRTELKNDIRELRNELKSDIAELRTELKGDTAELRVDFKSDIDGLRSDMRTHTYWIIGSIITLLGLLPNIDKIADFLNKNSFIGLPFPIFA